MEAFRIQLHSFLTHTNFFFPPEICLNVIFQYFSLPYSCFCFRGQPLTSTTPNHYYYQVTCCVMLLELCIWRIFSVLFHCFNLLKPRVYSIRQVKHHEVLHSVCTLCLCVLYGSMNK